MSDAATLSGTAGDLQIAGELGFSTARALLEQVAERAAGASDIAIDLHGVTRVDSGGLALLIELLNRAQQQGQGFRVTEPPPQLYAIARASGVDMLLGIDSRQHSE